MVVLKICTVYDLVSSRNQAGKVREERPDVNHLDFEAPEEFDHVVGRAEGLPVQVRADRLIDDVIDTATAVGGQMSQRESTVFPQAPAQFGERDGRQHVSLRAWKPQPTDRPKQVLHRCMKEHNRGSEQVVCCVTHHVVPGNSQGS
jgi:hypothetical protein